ncbi:MAG TPA: ABC transporter substrate-binding protein [Streptosporangiaceae bacterium]|nr:ABC transporter substrate-binding protein [Streptosporangiaceae bacterium]
MKGKFLIAAAAALSLALTGCSGAKVTSGGGGKTVNLAVNPWVGYEADAAVVSYLLTNKLGYKVNKKNLKEEISWQGFATGEVDAILENWGHDDLKKKYIDQQHVAAAIGPDGNEGIIGWYVPHWMVQKYPDILDSKNLNKYASLFKTSESGGKGQLLDGDPSYVTNDAALITGLKLNYKVVQGGSEAALIKSLKEASDQQKPLLFYFYEPQWFFAQGVKLDRIQLPPYTTGCDSNPKSMACDYPPYHLDKIVSTKFQKTGGKAYQLISNFKWTNDNQNQVAEYIANENMTDDQAAKKWVDANPSIWQAWMPK